MTLAGIALMCAILWGM
ncbi:hypothetical protein ACI5GA_025465 [Pseudomonas sp. Pseu.R1]